MLHTKRFDRSTPPPMAVPFQPPRLCYFISRSNGNIVPLVPADELPYSVRLTGVPRAMKMEQTCGMNHVGAHPFTGQYFKLETDATQHVIDHTSGSKQRFTAPSAVLLRDEQVKPEPTTPSKTEQAFPHQPPISATAMSWRRPDDAASARSQVIIDNILASESRSPARASPTALKVSRTSTSSPSSLSELGDKVYCTHWIRHGECDYTQQGCRYKHEMPDRSTLASIGFRTVPRWWQEKVAVQLGQSAIPTVGPAMKPAEWLKQRRSSQDSQSDDESDIELEVEAESDKESDIAAVLAKERPQPNIAATTDSAAEDGKKTPGLDHEEIQELLDDFVPRARVIKTTETVGKSTRSMSNGDLIDLSPTTTIPCVGNLTALDLSKAHEQPSTKLPLALPKPESKQPTTPPRKVFVPAGESPEFHVADARKHAQTQKAKLESSIDVQQSNKQDTGTQKQSPARPFVILKRPVVKFGLAAFIHAPQAVREQPSRSDCSSAATEPRSTSHKAGNNLPEPKASKSLIGSQSHSRTTEAAKPMARNPEAMDVRPKSPKATRAQCKHNPPSVCRPRRPAASPSKTVDKKSSTGISKAKEAKK
jgi:hypothetical protein